MGDQPPAKRARGAGVDAAPRVALITGASSGVGAHLVRHFAAKGWKVAALARSEEKLRAVCREAGAGALAVPCDVARREEAVAAVRRAEAELGPIGLCISNAAVGHNGAPFWKLTLDDVDRCIDINLKGTMYVVHEVLQGMVKRDTGYLFAIASVAGTWGIPNEAAYVASKHGMVGFMDTIANETRSTGVTVSTLCPGGIDTPWWTKDHPYGDGKNHADGSTSHLISTQEIVDIIDLQMQMPAGRVLKRLVWFPKGEWH
mmetsp:Transcript_47140/g.127181  ORF Transcript_47140/g.127181 Transcript_47140/m.127181 type:complete len:259 (+) Transcript_47140:47-823(+)